ncbi:hypothetical protein ACFPTX_02555 [Pseudomonas sp. GCM10022188]|uniref:hypothetical protein n=1 Tax=Pseudomonas TaxID=286 RepID=UPI001E5870D9|nr:hypothetical protein [Pseudomonas oryzagri]MCC6076592.1 hypothetical protein [Pseudomonas oryzagri]
MAVISLPILSAAAFISSKAALYRRLDSRAPRSAHANPITDDWNMDVILEKKAVYRIAPASSFEREEAIFFNIVFSC